MNLGSRKSARIVVIGNEVLSGKVIDQNSPFLLRRLRQLGVDCLGLVVVPDIIDVIAAAVREASAAADLVFTTGGVGPTHDDVTMESIAQAFDLPIIEHPRILELLEEHWRGPKAPARLRMALVPEGAEVIEGPEFPQVRVRNVYIFPGVPSLLQRRFEAIEELVRGPRLPCKALYTLQGESELAPYMEAVAREYPGVEIGSYPQWGNHEYRVLITLECSSSEDVEAATRLLANLVNDEDLVRIDEDYRPEDC